MFKKIIAATALSVGFLIQTAEVAPITTLGRHHGYTSHHHKTHHRKIGGMATATPSAAVMAQSAIGVYQAQLAQDLQSDDQDVKNAAQAAQTAVPEYAQGYRSFYQAVTPASASVRKAVDMYAPAKELFKKLKGFAKRFEIKTPSGIVGASRLSDEGNDYWQTIVETLSSPAASDDADSNE